MALSTRIAITVGDLLVQDRREFRFERRIADGRLQFEAVLDGERISMTDDEVARGVAAGHYRLISIRDPGRQPVIGQDFSAFPDQKKATARRRHAYLTGLRERGISSMTKQLVEPAISEIAASIRDKRPPGFSTVCKWQKMSGANLDIRCLVGRDYAKGRREWLDKAARYIMDATINKEFMTKQNLSISEVYRKIQGNIQKDNEALYKDSVIPYPSRATVYRAVAKLDRYDVEEARRGKRSADHLFNPVRQRKDPEFPLDLVEMDHTLLDLFVVDDEHMLPIGRPWLTLATDRCTRIPLGWYIGFEPPSVHSVMQCLRFAMLPKPDFNAIFSNDVIASWSDQLIDLVDGPRIINDFPCHGFPRELSLDRGMEFIGTDLADFCASQGISIQNAPRKSPEYKGAIERFFGTINLKLLHKIKGTTFSNIFERPEEYNPVNNAVIPFTMLQWLTCKFFIDEFAVDRHSGLGNIPIQAWIQKTNEFPIRCVHDITELDMLMGRVDYRTLQRTGIEFENLFYINDEVVSWLIDPKFIEQAPNRRVKLKYDPGDITTIRVLDPRTNRYLVVPVSDVAAEYAAGLSMWVHQRVVAKRNQDIESSRDVEGLIRARRQIETVLSSVWSGRQGKISARKKAARALGVGRAALGTTSTPMALSPLAESPAVETAKSSTRETPMDLLVMLRSRRGPTTIDASDDDDIYARMGATKPSAPKDK